MPNNTLTFEIGGQIQLKDLDTGIRLFTRLVNALTPRDRVAWIVHDLQPGSALITIESNAVDAAAVECVVRDYETIGKHLANGASDCPPALSVNGNARAVQAADALKDFALSGAVEYLRFETASDDFTICGPAYPPPRPAPTTISIGEVKGTVQIFSNANCMRFILYDDLHGKAVACYLQSGQENIVRTVWGRRASVIGTITRDAIGKPVAIREIMKVEAIKEVAPDAYKQARGAIPWKPGNKRPEEVIRQMRDAW